MNILLIFTLQWIGYQSRTANGFIPTRPFKPKISSSQNYIRISKTWGTPIIKTTSLVQNYNTGPLGLAKGDDEWQESNQEEEGRNGAEDDNDILWLRNAMSKDLSSSIAGVKNAEKDFFMKHSKLESGLAGFAVEPELGFVSILTGDFARSEKFTYAVMSPTDIDNVSSAEALCLVQLAGGLDLGAAVFPPETLARIVSEYLESDDEDEMMPFENVEDLRSRVTLVGVTVEKNENYSIKKEQPLDIYDRQNALKEGTPAIPSTATRSRAINVSAPKILSAVKNLPGLGQVSMIDIIKALNLHADSDGNLDRNAFSQFLGTLRLGLNRARFQDQRVKFQITVSISSDSNISSNISGLKLLNLDNVPPFQAVALSLRYNVHISVPDHCFDFNESATKSNIFERFPAFKPIQELKQDAQGISGSIATMFFKQSSPKNDDK